MTYWILVADAAAARLYSITGRKAPLRLERQFSHPDSRLRAQELQSDAPGRFNSKGSSASRSAVSTAASAHDHQAEQFAVQLTDMLQKGAERKAFGALAMIAPPHFLGLLRKGLTPEVERRLRTSIPQDLIPLNAEALRPHLEELLGPRDLVSMDKSLNL